MPHNMHQEQCRYCHEMIASDEIAAHETEHRKLRPDGQQEEYVTLPEEDRETGSLDGVPRVYKHDKCGGMTGMPEEIIRSYLANPWLYMADASYCCGCEKHVPCRELVWVETGENMQLYNDRLRAEKPQFSPALWKRMLLAALNLFR